MAKTMQFTLDASFAGAQREFAKMLQSIGKNEDKLKALTRELAKMGRKLEEVPRKGKQANDGLGQSFDRLKGQIVGIVGGYATISQGIATITRHYQTWLQQSREVSQEVKKATREMIAFAALQEGGTKAARVREAAQLGARYGITDLGQVWDIVQAMQSAPGRTFATGMQAAQTVFAAQEVGIPLEAGYGIEAVAATMGLPPGQAVRGAYVAGQMSTRTPAVVARAGPALPAWKDPETMLAAAGILAGPYPERLEVYTRQAGLGLSDISAAAKAKGEGRKRIPGIWERLGVAEGTELERLRALSAAGLTTPEALGQAGFAEKRQMLAISFLTQNVGRIEEILAGIQSRAVPGLFGAQRAAVEAEIPTAQTARNAEILGAMYRHQLALGDEAPGAIRLEQEQRIRGLAMYRSGLRRGPFGVALMDEEGRATAMGGFRAGLGAELQRAFHALSFGLLPGDVRDKESYVARYESYLPKLDEVRAELMQISEHSRQTADNTRGSVETPIGTPGTE